MKINEERMLKEFKKLVSIDSPSFGEKEKGEYIKKCLTSLGFIVSEDDAGKIQNSDAGNIYGFLDGNINEEPILFSAHMDTVEPSKGKEAIIGDDGIIRSNGKTVLGADDCSGIAAILEALRTIKEFNIPHRPIEVLFTIAEELFCEGSGNFDFSKIKSKEAYVFDLAGPVGSAAYKAPTIISFTITVNGKSAHAGFAPEEGIHAVAAAANAISKVKMGRIDDETTINIGVISGGKATNIIPDKCEVKGEVRSFSNINAENQLEIIKKQFTKEAKEIGATIDLQFRYGCQAFETKLDHPVVKRFEKACNDLGLKISLEKTFGGSDNNYLVNNGIAGIVVATAMSKCHTVEEFTTVDELYKAAKLAAALMS